MSSHHPLNNVTKNLTEGTNRVILNKIETILNKIKTDGTNYYKKNANYQQKITDKNY